MPPFFVPGGIRVHPTIEPTIRTFITKNIPLANRAAVRDWVAKFSRPNGQITISSFLVLAQEDRKLDAALEVLAKFWESDFKYQHPDGRGDPDALPKTRDLLDRMYRACEMKTPQERQADEPEPLPGAFTIRTRNSIYHLDAKPASGPRTLTRERDGKTWKGRLVSVKLGKSMYFSIEEGPDTGDHLITSDVIAISK